MDIKTMLKDLINEVEKLEYKHKLSLNVKEGYYEPGMMENLDQFAGLYDESDKSILIKTAVKGMRYENRTLRLDSLNVGDEVYLVREKENKYNSNNFKILNNRNSSLGNLSADLCNVIAPLYDAGYLIIDECSVSYIERLKDRSRYAEQGVLFIRIAIKLRGI